MPSTSPNTSEEGVNIPFGRIKPETLNNLIEEFVSREWSSLSDDGYTLEIKVAQVFEQLQTGKVQVVFDITSGTVNLVSTA